MADSTPNHRDRASAQKYPHRKTVRLGDSHTDTLELATNDAFESESEAIREALELLADAENLK